MSDLLGIYGDARLGFLLQLVHLVKDRILYNSANKAQRGQVACPGSQSEQVAELMSPL